MTDSTDADRPVGDRPADQSAPAGSGDADSTPRSSNNRRRGGRNRRPRTAGTTGAAGSDNGTDAPSTERPGSQAGSPTSGAGAGPGNGIEPGAAVAARPPQPPRKPKIGDTMPAPVAQPAASAAAGAKGEGSSRNRRRRRGRGGPGGSGGSGSGSGSGGSPSLRPVEAVTSDRPVELDAATMEARRGKERNGRPVGRYMMSVHVSEHATHIAVLEGRALIEHYVSLPADDATQIHGNIYLGKVQNVLPGMEAAFVDIGTPKNAVLYRGDVQYDTDDVEQKGAPRRIEQILQNRQTILCQVTKNPIAHKGARLTQEISLPGRFVVLVPNSTTYGISKRLPDDERKRLRKILDRVKPSHHGVIVRTAAENVIEEEIERDVARLLGQWDNIERLSKQAQAPALLYREPDMAVRVIREEFNKEYRGVVIDDPTLYTEVHGYVSSIMPALADRVQYFDRAEEPIGLFERHHIAEQLRKTVDAKVWLPSGGSLVIEHTEALTVIDVNTGKNVGSSSLEETVFRNNLEAAEEIARQLRLRDIGGIIVIDFVDMEEAKNRDAVMRLFRDALSRDKTRTQVFNISELGLVEMTRKRIGEGLIESLSHKCPTCEGRGVLVDDDLIEA